jgi:hypothetical protein
MLHGIEKDQRARILHRINFIGRPAGANTISWQYRGQPWRFKRPEDGRSPVLRSATCAVCHKALTYTIYSIGDTHRRYRRKRELAWAGLAALLAAGAVLSALLASHHASALGLAVTIPVGFIGLETAWVAGMAVGRETGVSGHLNGWPGATKHEVGLVAPPSGMPRLICPECGHEEEFPFGPEHRQTYVERQYRAAQARLEQHECG